MENDFHCMRAGERERGRSKFEARQGYGVTKFSNGPMAFHNWGTGVNSNRKFSQKFNFFPRSPKNKSKNFNLPKRSGGLNRPTDKLTAHTHIAQTLLYIDLFFPYKVWNCWQPFDTRTTRIYFSFFSKGRFDFCDFSKG